MKKCWKQRTMWSACGVFAGFMQACATGNQQATDAHLQEMEKQIMQLRAENANLQARTRELDDKVLLYEKKEALGTQKQARAHMQTVRLTGASDGGPEAETETESSVSFREEFSEDKNEKRPVLRLDDNSVVSYDRGNQSNASANGPSSPRSWNTIPASRRGDNLGVLSAEGQLQQTEADSMELFNAAYRSYNNKEYAAARAGFSTFLQHESNHRFADNAMFWIAECHLAEGELFKAVGEFERLLRRYPKSEQAASSLYRIGFIYDRMNDTAKAWEYYFRVVETFPGSEAARKASKRMTERNGNARLVRTSEKR